MDENERQKRLIEEEEETHAQNEDNNIIEQTSDGISNNDEIDPAEEEIQETVIMENKDHNEEEFDETSKHIIEQLPERIRNKLTDDQLYIHLSLFIKFLKRSLSSAKSIDEYCEPKIGKLLSFKNFASLIGV